MVAQLNCLMALCVLLALPAMAAPDNYQTLVVNGDTLVVQMAEPLPAGYQALIMGGDTLIVQVLAEPLPTDGPLSAANDDSLSVQKRATEISPQAAVGDSASTHEKIDRHLLNSILMGDPFRSASAVSDSTERVERFPVQAGSMDDMGSGKRVAQKLISGALVGGVVGGMGGLAGLGVGLAIEDCSDCPHGHNCDLCGIGAALTALLGGTVGYLVGTAIGVSGFDPHDRFIASLGGSVVGLIGGIGLTSASPGVLWPSLLVGPVVGATLASELWRKPPQNSQNSRVSVSLGPTPNGGLSAVAQLRF